MSNIVQEQEAVIYSIKNALIYMQIMLERQKNNLSIYSNRCLAIVIFCPFRNKLNFRLILKIAMKFGLSFSVLALLSYEKMNSLFRKQLCSRFSTTRTLLRGLTVTVSPRKDTMNLDQLDELVQKISLGDNNEDASSSTSSSSSSSVDFEIEDVEALLKDGKVKNIVMVVGAGISTSAGIPDFRTPGTGLYRYSPDDMCLY